MSTGALIWLIIFSISAVLFFGVAAIAGMKGAGELLDLLRRTEQKNEQEGG